MNERQKVFSELVKIAREVVEESEILPDDYKKLSLSDLDFHADVVTTTGAATVLRQLQRELLTPYNEGIGPDVEKFWTRVEARGLDVERRDRVKEVLASGKIPHIEVFWDLDEHFEFLQECGKVSPEEAERLNEILEAFATAPQNRRFFGDDDADADDGGEEPGPMMEEPEKFDVPVGQLARITEFEYRYDYWGMEKYDLLAEQGYQGGGYTWEGIIQGLLEMHAIEVLGAIRFDAEGDCVCVWSDDVEALKRVAEEVVRALESDELLLKAAARGAAE